MLKKLKIKTIIIGSVILMALVLLIGFTYAYFTARVVGNDTAKSTQVYAGTMALRLNGSTQITCNNLYPGGTCTYNFSVENTGTLTTSYELDFVDVLNDLEVKNELVYSLTKDSQVQITENEAPSVGEMILPAVVIEPDAIQQYTLTLTFKETGNDQSYNQDEHFGARVNIRGIDSSNYLQAKVLARHIYNETPDFTEADPVRLSIENVTPNVEWSKNSNVTGNRILGTGYTFNERSGLYTLTGVSENQVYDSNSIGKYTCYTGTDTLCGTMYKINEVQETVATENYTETITPNQTTTLSKNGAAIASSYYLDQATGNFTLSGTVEENQTYSNDSIGKYTCNKVELTCTTLYKINSVTDSKVDNADKYSRSANYNKITDADRYRKEFTNKIYSQSGLYRSNDDDGVSYYFRGNIKNNYVNFGTHSTDGYRGYSSETSSNYKIYNTLSECNTATSYNYNCTKIYSQGDPIVWKIVRINGDGSIRLVLSEYETRDKYKTGKYAKDIEQRYLGLTYDNRDSNGNSIHCTKTQNCTTTYNATNNEFESNFVGTSENTKTTLETWYKQNLANVDNQIVLSSYCNDTTSVEGPSDTNRYFGPYGRVVNATATLMCPDTDKDFGGLYKHKIGLLTADEIIMAGLPFSDISATSTVSAVYSYSRSNAESGNYLYLDGSSSAWTISPWFTNPSSMVIALKNGHMNYGGTNSASIFLPVISIKGDTIITGGDGSKDNPYQVQ